MLGGSAGPVRAYNSNGLWLGPPAATADEAPILRDEGGFGGLKLRLGRERPKDDIAAIETIRRAVGDDMHLMADFNQGLDMAEALRRCPMIDDLGTDLDRGADPVRKSRRAARCWRQRIENSDPDRREFLRTRATCKPRSRRESLRLRDAGFDADRRALPAGCDRRRFAATDGRAVFVAPLSGILRASAARDTECALAGMAGLGRPDPAAGPSR
jgi:hypothetical protein